MTHPPVKIGSTTYYPVKEVNGHSCAECACFKQDYRIRPCSWLGRQEGFLPIEPCTSGFIWKTGKAGLRIWTLARVLGDTQDD